MGFAEIARDEIRTELLENFAKAQLLRLQPSRQSVFASKLYRFPKHLPKEQGPSESPEGYLHQV
jgi:hypothetical protein